MIFVRVMVDSNVETGHYRIGGVEVLSPDDARKLTLDQVLNRRMVFCHDEQEAVSLRKRIKLTGGMELVE